MKKLLFILLACFISVSMVSLGIAQTPDGIPADQETICDDAGLTGSEWDLCNAYCQAQDCNDLTDLTRSCMMLRKNYAKHTGTEVMPCDMVACAICGDPDPCNQQGTLGVCQEIMSYQCDAIAGSLNVGEYACEQVTIPADVEPGCSQIPPEWGLIPDCQYTGPAFVCNFFIGGVLVDRCPAPPTCLAGCGSDDDCYNETGDDGNQFICVDGLCAPVPDSCTEDGDCQSCVCVAEQCVPQPASCDEDADCGTSDVCVGNVCVECRADEACGVDNFCVGNACVDCIENTDCPEASPFCKANGACVACLTNADCEEPATCRNNGTCR